MARQVTWADSAVDDLAEVADYIAKDSEFYAAAVVRELVEAGRSLGYSPNVDASYQSIDILQSVSCW